MSRETIAWPRFRIPREARLCLLGAGYISWDECRSDVVIVRVAAPLVIDAAERESDDVGTRVVRRQSWL